MLVTQHYNEEKRVCVYIYIEREIDAMLQRVCSAFTARRSAVLHVGLVTCSTAATAPRQGCTTRRTTSPLLLLLAVPTLTSPLASSLTCSTRTYVSLTSPLLQQQQSQEEHSASSSSSSSTNASSGSTPTAAAAGDGGGGNGSSGEAGAASHENALDVAMRVNKLKRLHQTSGAGSNKKQVEREAWGLLNSLTEEQINVAEGKAVSLLLNSWAYFAKFWEKGKDGPANF